MKVDKNKPISEDAWGESNIPIRLEIASRILAGMFAQDRSMHEVAVMALNALEYADALIQAHNETCEERTSP